MKSLLNITIFTSLPLESKIVPAIKNELLPLITSRFKDCAIKLMKLESDEKEDIRLALMIEMDRDTARFTQNIYELCCEKIHRISSPEMTQLFPSLMHSVL